MGRIGIFAVAVIFAGLVMASCATDKPGERPRHYTYMLFRISAKDYNSVAAPRGSDFAAFWAYKESLLVYAVERPGSGMVVSGDDLYRLLLQQGFSDAGAKIARLNSVGNNFVVFEFAPDSSYYVVMYFEKI